VLWPRPAIASRAALCLATRVALCVALAAGLAACSRSPCEQTCRRVSACKREAKMGEALPGESAPPADPACMARCEAASDEFAACEGKRRECAAVLECIPYRDPR
jgi:hypothetical protein